MTPTCFFAAVRQLLAATHHPLAFSISMAEVRDRFDEISNGIKGAIDFVRTNLHVERLENLPYPTLLVPLALLRWQCSGVHSAVSGAAT